MNPSFCVTTLLAIACLTLVQCAKTTVSTGPKIPIQKTNIPRYQTDEQIRKRITAIEKELQKSPDDVTLLLNIAALSQEVKNFDKALFYMERLKALGYKEDPRLYGSMGSIYKSKEQFEEARSNYLIFKSLLPASSKTISKIDKELAQIDFIIETLASKYEINVRPLSASINTDNSEYLPQFTMDGSTIIFTRRFFNQEDLFTAYKTTDGYETEPIDEINTLLNEGAHTISADGTLLIFTHCDKKRGFGSCDLYRSRKKSDGSWSKPANMGRTINTRHWESQPSLSADGRRLYFSSRRTGGYGGSDIYMSTIKEDRTWSVPQNLGPKVNTKANDEAPFIHADGQTLYFRSVGHQGLGEYDLYKSVKKENSWSAVIHLGSPINTTGEDGALVVSLDGTRGYYASDSYHGQKQDHLDLFEFDLPLAFRPSPMTFVRGRVIDRSTKIPLRADIKVAYLDDVDYTTYYKANANGEFLAAIPIGRPTLLNISAENYVFHSDHVFFEEVRYSVDPYTLNVTLAEISTPERSEPVILKNIFFESGSAALLSTSASEIDILYNLLLSRPKIRVEILGHTDNVGSDIENAKLSKARAEAVKSALVDKGISADRLTATGRGEEAPIDTNDTEEGRSNNRRTEFIIIK